MASTNDTVYTVLSDTELRMTRTFDAPARLVFDAFTKPEHLPHWMIGPEGWTMPVCEIDLRPGGAWHYVWEHADSGERMSMDGEFREVRPHDRLVRTESWGPEWPETLCTLELTESGGRTTITDTILYPSREARDAALATGMNDGADRSLVLLAEYLRTLTADSASS